MQITQSLSQRQELRLIMTRQMIQSIEMLQLPLMDLQQNINQELVSNPWLETTEGDAEAPDTGGTKIIQKPAAAEDPKAADPEAERIKRMETLIQEWNDPRTRSERSGRSFGEEDAKLEAMQNTAAPGTSLEDHLLQQLHLSKESPRTKELAEVIVGSLDLTGYLKIPLMDLFFKNDGGIRRAVFDEDVTDEEADLALALVQSFDPAGVGARDITECLLLQLKALKGDTIFEEQLVEKHLDDLKHNRLPKIAKELGVDIDEIKDGLSVIAHLNPNPGRGFGGTRPQYVVPDVIVEEIDGELILRINEHFLPPLRVSQDQLNILKAEPKDSPTRDYILNKLGSAVWLMESVIQRRNTLYRITQQIVDLQRAFFEHGPSHLRPMMMQEIAERIGMHVSTVSRALAGKYIQTPQGLYPMKYFFTGGFNKSSGDGESESNRAIMLKIQEMVKGESKDNPLSDQEIVERLGAEGIDIARRTVAKYREKLNIPSSRQRKEY